MSPYTNDNYIVNFTSSDNPVGSSVHANDAGGGSLTLNNSITRTGVRAANWVISSYEEMPPGGSGDWINAQTVTWLTTEESMYENLYFYDWISQSQYYPWQIGNNRDNPTSPKMPIALTPGTQTSWPTTMSNLFCNANYSDFNWIGHSSSQRIGGGPWEIPSWNYVTTMLDGLDVTSWLLSSGKNWKMRKVGMWGCYTARSANYQSWIRTFVVSTNQMKKMMGKNGGIFFNGEVLPGYYGGDMKDCISEVAEEFDQIWVMGANPYPGGCNPNYSLNFAYNITEGIFPEIQDADPVIAGCPYLPYAGVYDDQLMQLDFHQVIQ